ncbi:MAG: LON peptidase substrate-binding domain-containing protein [bacterium]
MNIESKHFELPGAFSGVIPIFPLGGTVFFPKTLLPLRIFEPRYKLMLRDSLLGEKLIGIVYSSRTESGQVNVHKVGTIGRIAFLETVDTGDSNVILAGVERFFMFESPVLGDYLTSKVNLYPEALPSPEDPVIHAQLSRLVEMISKSGVFDIGEYHIPHSGGALLFQYHSLINAFCSVATASLDTKQRWLELDSVVERYRRVVPVLQDIVVYTRLLEKLGHLAPSRDKLMLN